MAHFLTLIWGGFCGCESENYSLEAEMFIYETQSVIWLKNPERIKEVSHDANAQPTELSQNMNQ